MFNSEITTQHTDYWFANTQRDQAEYCGKYDVLLTHCPLLMLYGTINVGQHWFR